MKVKELMTEEVIVLSEDQTVRDAVNVFVENHIDGAPVVDQNNKLTNIITKTDIMKVYLEGMPLSTKINKIFSKKIETVCEDTDIDELKNVNKGRFPVVDKNGKLVGILTRTDVSKCFFERGLQKKYKGYAAEKISKKLDAVIESSYDGIYITDGDANTLKINKAYERISGVKREEMIGSNMIQLEKEGYISESATLKVLKTKRIATINQEFKTGKKALVTSTPIVDEDGKISMVVTNVRDVTQLVKLKEQLGRNKELAKKYYSEIKEMRLQFLDTLNMVAEDEKMLETIEIARRVAKVDTTVLVLGETGVGKEEVAKFIHKNSHRKQKQFIKINCGAIPQNLIESELFGYEKGAFTGANKDGKMGLFEVANGGTLFLDEVGELSLEMQVKLLRVLQEQEIKRVGGTMSIKIDVRILAATNRDLEEMVRNKCFREDLYYRLNVVPLNILPLRERRGDIIPLIDYFFTHLNDKYAWNKEIDKDALQILYKYDWPGNVRELKNIVERIFIMSENNVITSKDLPKMIVGNKSMVGPNETMPLKDAVAKLEKELIDQAFKKHKNVRSAAKSLGIDASTFVRKRKKYEDV